MSIQRVFGKGFHVGIEKGLREGFEKGHEAGQKDGLLKGVVGTLGTLIVGGAIAALTQMITSKEKGK